MLGVAYTAVAAVFFGLNGATFRRGVLGGSALQGVYVTVLGGVPLFLLAALVTQQAFRLEALELRAYVILAASGVLHFLLGRYSNFRAYAALGQTRAQPLIQASTLVSVVIAVLFLRETVTLLMAMGIALVMAGPAISATQAAPAPSAAATLAPPVRLAEGYAFGTVNALAFGVSPVLVRYALGDSGLGIVAGLTAYMGAAAVLALGFALPGVRASLAGMNPGARGWFAVGTLTVFAAHMFRFLALSAAPVSVVIPLLRGGAFLHVIAAWLINRDYETFDRRVLVGIGVSVSGSVALVV